MMDPLELELYVGYEISDMDVGNQISSSGRVVVLSSNKIMYIDTLPACMFMSAWCQKRVKKLKKVSGPGDSYWL